MKPVLETIPLREIAICERFRKDLGDIEGLMNSISSVGLLSPPMVGTDGVLIHGRRRIEACKRLGWKEIPVITFDPEDALLAERDENEIRKSFTESERVAIAQAIKEKLGNRQGQRTDKEELRENFPEVEKGQRTDEVAAKAAGFGNRKTFQQAEKVVHKGVEPLVHAMDAGTVSISAAAELASEPPEVQQDVLQKGPEAVKQHAKAKREERKAKPKPLPRPAADDEEDGIAPFNDPIPQESSDDEDEEEYPLTEEDIFEREFQASLKVIDEAVKKALALKDDPEQRMRVKAHLNFCNSLIKVF
jgi:ParB-like chromosome segregation protein Spo0J